MKIISDVAWEAIQTESTWLRARVIDAELRISALTEQIIELKRDGFARPSVQAAQQVVQPVVDDRIMAAIRAMAPEGSRLEGELMQFANAALLAEEEVEDIADQILAGADLGDD